VSHLAKKDHKLGGEKKGKKYLKSVEMMDSESCTSL